MNSFAMNMRSIRKMMSNLKDEKYAITNQFLVEQDEYVKSLYMKVLCTIIQYENDSTEMQILFAKRILRGISLEDSLEEYMRKALDISENDMQEFFDYIGENELKYYFALDGLLLVSMGKWEQASIEYLAEILELLDVTKEDLDYVILVAKSILKQESWYYNEAKHFLNERVIKVDYMPYMKNYYAGKVVDTDSHLHYYAPKKELSGKIEYLSEYHNQKIVFENLDIVINSEWTFSGCECVTFKNCTINGENNYLSFESVGSVVFEQCIIRNFSNRFAKIASANNILVSSCEFYDCGFTCDGDKTGGIFFVKGNAADRFEISSCKFQNCYIAAKTYRSNYGVTGVVVHFAQKAGKTEIEISGNKFVGCSCRNNGNYVEALVSYEMGYGNAYKNNERDNQCTGELSRIFR